MTHQRLGTRNSLEPSNRWSSTTVFLFLFSHRFHQAEVHLEELNLSHKEPNPEDAIEVSEEAEEVRSLSEAESVVLDGCCGLVDWPRRDIIPNPVLESSQDTFLEGGKAGDPLGNFLLHDLSAVGDSRAATCQNQTRPEAPGGEDRCSNRPWVGQEGAGRGHLGCLYLLSLAPDKPSGQDPQPFSLGRHC